MRWSLPALAVLLAGCATLADEASAIRRACELEPDGPGKRDICESMTATRSQGRWIVQSHYTGPQPGGGFVLGGDTTYILSLTGRLISKVSEQ